MSADPVSGVYPDERRPEHLRNAKSYGGGFDLQSLYGIEPPEPEVTGIAEAQRAPNGLVESDT